MSVTVLREGTPLSQNEIECDSLPTCEIKDCRSIPWLSFHGPDVRKVCGRPVLAHHPKTGTAPARSGVPASLKVADAATTFHRLTNLVKNRVVPFDERHKVGVVPWISDAIPILVSV